MKGQALPKGTCLSLDGQRFGKLVVRKTFRKPGYTACVVDCDCGTKGHVTRALCLKQKHSKTCGCGHANRSKLNRKG